MKTQCPNCKTDHEIPEVYANKQVKCKKCKQPFTATQYASLAEPKTSTVSDKNKHDKLRASFWRSGVYLQVLGCLGIMASVCFAFVYSESLSLEKNIYWGLYATSYIGARTFLIETLIFGIAFVGMLLSLVLIGLGSIVKNLQKNKF